MEIDSNGLMELFNTSRCNLLRYEREGKFPKHHRMIRNGTKLRKIWLVEAVDDFVSMILQLHESGLTSAEIAKEVHTTQYFANRALKINRREHIKQSDIFKQILKTSAKLGVN